MKYTTYYENNELITYEQYEERMKDFEGKNNSRIAKDIVTRKVVYRSSLAEEMSEDEEHTRYSICMRDYQPGELYLERKSEQDGLIYKSYVKISKRDCKRILAGDIAWMRYCNKTLVQDFYLELTINGLAPVFMEETTKDVCENINGQDGIVFYKSIRMAKDCYLEFFNREYPMVDGMNCDTLVQSYKKSARIPLAIAGIIHMRNAKVSTLAYSL